MNSLKLSQHFPRLALHNIKPLMIPEKGLGKNIFGIVLNAFEISSLSFLFKKKNKKYLNPLSTFGSIR